MSDVIKCGVLTVSDSCFSGEASDRGGPAVIEILNSGKIFSKVSIEVVETGVVPDDVNQIQAKLIEWASVKKLDLIVTTGGTGLSPRDVTPEAVKGVIERDIVGMSFAMMAGSLEITPMAMISRPVCGVKGKTVIITVPGSPKAAKECLGIVAPVLPHALDLVRGVNDTGTKKLHQAMQHGHSCPHHASEQTSGTIEPSDPSKVARRHRTSPYPLISVEEALDVILSKTPSPDILETEEINVLDAIKRTLSQDVKSFIDIPPFDASIMDGYAVVSSDGAGERLVVKLASTAGTDPRTMSELKSGYCARINTGAPLPVGADAVVKVEDTELVEEAGDGAEEVKIRILNAPLPGTDIRPKGCDISSNSTVLKSGTVLAAPDIGILCSIGVTSVNVFRQPRIAILSSGNEVVDPFTLKDGNKVRSGQIFDSNSPMLASLLKSKGFLNVERVGVAPDDENQLHDKLRSVLSSCDVLITTGGVSMGEKDLFKHVLTSQLKANVFFGRVNVKPGKPTTFATIPADLFSSKHDKLIFALPGNPVSAFVTANLFVLSSLRKFCGLSPFALKIQAELDSNFLLDPRPEYHRVFLKSREEGICLAVSTGNQLSSRLLSVSSADALLVLPSADGEKKSLKKGSVVDALLM